MGPEGSPLVPWCPLLSISASTEAPGLCPLAQWLLLLLLLPPACEFSGPSALSQGQTLSPQGLPGWTLSPPLTSEWKLLLGRLRKAVPLARPLPPVPPRSLPLCSPGFPAPWLRLLPCFWCLCTNKETPGGWSCSSLGVLQVLSVPLCPPFLLPLVLMAENHAGAAGGGDSV